MAAEAIDFAVVDRDVVIVGAFADDEGLLAIATIGTVVAADPADGATVEVEEGTVVVADPADGATVEVEVSEIGGAELELTI